MGNYVSFEADDKFLKLVCKLPFDLIEKDKIEEIKQKPSLVKIIENHEENYIIILFLFDINDFL